VTRRGRILILAVVSLLLLAAFSIGRVSSRAADVPSPVDHRTVVVHAGDTLWSIAQRTAPHADPRVVVAEITHENHLGAESLRPGQLLVLP
jgi:Tfp pilus assembly protein FimV